MTEQALSLDCVALVTRLPSLKPPHPVQVNSGAMLATGASIGAIRLASDLIRHVWWPTRAPISFDVEVLSARLLAAMPESGWTPWRVRRYRAWAITFFASSGNDQWMPMADYFQAQALDRQRGVIPARRA